jgi:hypothetical protein
MVVTAKEQSRRASKADRGFPMVAATGMLGSGFRRDSIEKAIRMGARFVGCDAGSTDPGPRSLAQGEPQFSREAVKRDTGVILEVARAAGLPVILGSAGTSGADGQVQWQADIVRELAAELNLHFRMALIRSEQSKGTVRELLQKGRIRPLAPTMTDLTESAIDNAVTIVAMMGVEPIQSAFVGGAEVIIAGRCSDPAIYAALPLLEGYDPGIVWHAAKTIECGAAPVISRAAPDSMMAILREDAFDVFPLREDYRCTPQSIASHSLYENANPFEIQEPGGRLVTTDATYTAQTDSAVRVAGAKFIQSEQYAVKLEGVRHVGYATVLCGAIRDPYILEDLDNWLMGLSAAIKTRLGDVAGIGDGFEIYVRVYGLNGVLREIEAEVPPKPHEVLVMWDVVGETQELAHKVAKSICHLAIHHPVAKWHGLITGVALPFSPPEIDRGPVYEFHLNHVAAPDSPLDLFPIEYLDV